MRRSAFFNRHMIGIGLSIIIAALLINLYVQYRSLAKLGETLPAANKTLVTKRLQAIGTEIDDFYRHAARNSFDLPRRAFDPGLAMDFAALDALVKSHYQNKSCEGIKRFFAMTMAPSTGKRVLSMLDPHSGKMLEGDFGQEGWAAFVASAPWMTQIWRQSAVLKQPSLALLKEPVFSPDQLFLVDNDPDNPVILQPITDDSSRLIGVAGLIIDKQYFKDVWLPRTLASAGKEYFPDAEFDDLALTVTDEKNNLVAATRTLRHEGAEIKVPFQFVFPRWQLGVKSQGLTQEEVGRRYLITNLSLSALLTLIIIGGTVFALRAASRAMKLSQMKADFVSNVSHELRTPLSSIRVFGEFQRLGRVRDPVKVREYGEFIETESRRLTQLINNILDFSRIESGQKTYRFTQADVAEVVTDAIRTFAVRLQQDGFTVRVEAPERPLPTAVIDPEAIGQVVVNLLDNAVKYSGSSREILIQLSHRYEFVTIEVSDQGVGIPAEEREKIFERFHRVSTGLVHDVKGSGLGLSLVKHIAEAHGGRVTVQSEVGRGSTFTVFLPVWQGNAESTEQPRAIAPAQKATEA